MDLIKSREALGLMSSSALDGVQAAAITTDGVDVFARGPAEIYPYDDLLLERLRALYARKTTEDNAALQAAVEREFTEFVAAAAEDFISAYDLNPQMIGFHGHTIEHNPQEHYIRQIGDGALLAKLTGREVVNRFRYSDLASGGQGAPLSTVYLNALTGELPRPLVVLNLSGISSLSWFGASGEMLAFDIGPGSSAINDWVMRHGGMHTDYNGRLAATGRILPEIVSSMMRHKYLAKMPPKAMDRNLFNEKLEHLEGLSLEDGAATVTAYIAETIAYSMALYLPEMPPLAVVIGSGCENPTLLRQLRSRLAQTEVLPAGHYGWNAAAIEAEAFAFLAVRRQALLPASYPSTTGVPEPAICGEIYSPEA